MQPYEGQPQSGDSQPYPGYAEQYDPSGQATPQSTTYDDWDVPTMPRGNSGRTLIIAIVSLLVLAGVTGGVLYSLGYFSDDGPSPVGTWLADGTEIEFTDDGNIEGDEVSGSWEVDEDTMTLNFDTMSTAGQDIRATYRYDIIDDVLFMKPEKMSYIDENGDRVTEDENYDSSCFALVRKSAVTDSNTVAEIIDDVDSPSWCDLIAQNQNQPESGTHNSYAAYDMDASISTGNTDTLMQIRWQHAEDDLSWAFVSMRLEVGDNVFDCSIDGSSDCVIVQDGSEGPIWETSEFLTLSENAADICGGAGEVTCDVSIHVTYRGTVVAGTSDIALS
ncbi:MAG TPA: hypothetical protein EYQ80_00520 [Candidatus Poseidoniales archaeon]|nr:hypothetical protein [Candidatus Poseidoniales archaeon]